MEKDGGGGGTTGGVKGHESGGGGNIAPSVSPSGSANTATPQTTATAPTPTPGQSLPGPSPLVIGKSFIKQYYQVLSKNPEQIHRFYKPSSVVSHGLEASEPTVPVTIGDVQNSGGGANDGETTTTTTTFRTDLFDWAQPCPKDSTDESDEPDVVRFDFGRGAIDAQESLGGAVLLVVTGHITLPQATRPRPFVHTFFLNNDAAPGKKRQYYVHNDVLRFLAGEEALEDTPAPITASKPPTDPTTATTSASVMPEPTPAKVDVVSSPAEPVPPPVSDPVPTPVPASETSNVVEKPVDTHDSIVPSDLASSKQDSSSTSISPVQHNSNQRTNHFHPEETLVSPEETDHLDGHPPHMPTNNTPSDMLPAIVQTEQNGARVDDLKVTTETIPATELPHQPPADPDIPSAANEDEEPEVSNNLVDSDTPIIAEEPEPQNYNEQYDEQNSVHPSTPSKSNTPASWATLVAGGPGGPTNAIAPSQPPPSPSVGTDTGSLPGSVTGEDLMGPPDHTAPGVSVPNSRSSMGQFYPHGKHHSNDTAQGMDPPNTAGSGAVDGPVVPPVANSGVPPRNRMSVGAGSGGPNQQFHRVPEATLFIRNIPDRTREADIRSLFERYGRIMQITLIANRGFCFVDYDSADAVTAVLSDNAESSFIVHGRSLDVGRKVADHSRRGGGGGRGDRRPFRHRSASPGNGMFKGGHGQGGGGRGYGRRNNPKDNGRDRPPPGGGNMGGGSGGGGGMRGSKS